VTSEPGLPPVHRRIAVLPVVVAIVGLVTLAVVVTLVISLAAEPEPSADSSSPAPTSTSSAHEQEGAELDPSPVEPAGESNGARCIDYTNEADALDIREATVSQSDREAVAVELTLTSPVPQGSVQLGIYAEPSDDDRSYQFSVEIDDGEITSLTSYEFERDKRDRLDADDAELNGAAIRFTVPRNIGKKLGDEWSWFAFTTLDDTVRDSCPGDPGSFDTLRFEADD